MVISHSYWHLVVKNCNFTLPLTYSGQEWQFHSCYWHLVVNKWQFHIATDIHWSRMAISHCYWQLVVNEWVISHYYFYLVVNIGNFTLLLKSSGLDLADFTFFTWWTPQWSWMAEITLLLTSSGQKWQLHQMNLLIWLDGPPTCWMAISHCYWHLVVKNGNFSLLLTSIGPGMGNLTLLLASIVIKNGNFTLLLTLSGQQRQLHIPTDIQWSRMAISHCYWYQEVKNGNFTLLLISSGQEWPFHIATDIHWSRMAIPHCY